MREANLDRASLTAAITLLQAEHSRSKERGASSSGDRGAVSAPRAASPAGSEAPASAAAPPAAASAPMGALQLYTRDLTAEAGAGRLAPVIGREAAVRRVAAVLSLRTKNNPALLGAPGAGKAAVVEGLAHLLANGDVPQAVRGKRLIAVDFGALVGGATRRGEVEARLRALLSEAQQAEGEGAILYLDELHSLVGPPLDAAPLLKAALKASPKLRCIGASTLEQCAASSPQARPLASLLAATLGRCRAGTAASSRRTPRSSGGSSRCFSARSSCRWRWTCRP